MPSYYQQGKKSGHSTDTKSEGSFSLLVGEGGSSSSPLGPHQWLDGQECLITIPPVASTDITVGRVASLSVGKVQAPHLAFVGVGGGWGDHSFFCGIWVEQSSDCLKVFCLARLPFPGLSARESRHLVGLFVSVLTRIPGSSASSALGYRRQKRT